MNPPRPYAQLPIRVLVVDNSADVAVTLALLVKQLGHMVQVAHSGQQALAKAAAFRPDVIFLDIGLPDISGYEVCKEIRGYDRGKNSIIVALTGRKEPEDVIRSEKAGFDRHVGKPMFLATLQEILGSVDPGTLRPRDV